MKYLVLLLAVGLAAPASADRASDLNKAGLAAATDKNWELARVRFQEAFDLDARPRTRYNLAAAQQQTGRLIAARTNYVQFLADTQPGADDAYRKAARDAVAALEQTIPTLVVKTTGFVPGTTFDIDEAHPSAAELARPIPLDPGKHVIVARRGEEVVARREIVLTTGDHEELELAAPVQKPSPAVAEVHTVAPPPARPPHHSSSVFRSGWFWGITGVVVLGAVGAGYYYTREPDATRGTLGRGVIDL